MIPHASPKLAKFVALLFIGTPIIGTASSTLPAERTVQVQRAASDADEPMTALGAILVERDGLLATWRVPESAVEEAVGLGTVVVQESANFLRFRRIEIDTESARLSSLNRSITPGIRLRILQLAARPQQEDLARIAASGARIVAAIPTNGYILWSPDTECDTALLAAAQDLDWRFLGDFQSGWKLLPPPAPLSEGASILWELECISDDFWDEVALGSINALDGGTRREGASLNGGETKAYTVRATREQARTLAETLPSLLTISPVPQVLLFGEASGLALLNQTDVVSDTEIPRVPDPEATVPIPPYLSLLHQGMRVDRERDDAPAHFPVAVVVDNGIGSGDPLMDPFDVDPLDPEGPQFTFSSLRTLGAMGELDGPSRLIGSWYWAEVTTGSFAATTLDDAAQRDTILTTGTLVSHGHLVATVLAGRSSEKSQKTLTDNGTNGSSTQDGWLFDMGVAPSARIFNAKLTSGSNALAQNLTQSGAAGLIAAYYHDSVEASLTDWTTPTQDRFFQILAPRTVISTNSWATAVGGVAVQSYDLIAKAHDRAARRALAFDPDDPDTEGLRGVSFWAAHGNSDQTTTTLSPAIAKNVAAVSGTGGGCHEFPFTKHQNQIPPYPYEGELTGLDCTPHPTGNRDFDANSLWTNSVRGNPGYERAKPDVVAPAQLVTGNVESYSRPGDSNLGTFTYGRLALMSSPPEPVSPAPFLYAFASGTSYATPAVAGAATLSAGGRFPPAAER
jgi:hypothetical protein